MNNPQSSPVHATPDACDGGELQGETPGLQPGSVFKCSDCQKYCDEQGRWLKIDSAAVSIAVVELESAGEVKSITCDVCSNGFQRAACAATQVFDGVPAPTPAPKASPTPRPAPKPARNKPRKPFELRSSLPPTDR
jgi:hypothetical protein